jgi:general secretion pathway protein D
VKRLSFLFLAFLVPFLVPVEAHGQDALNLQNADIRAFIQDVAQATGQTFIVDPRVQGTVTIYSDGPIAPEELVDVLLSTLRANGLIAVPGEGDSFRIIPDEGAARQAVSGAEGFATEVYRLGNIDAAAAAETLRPLIGQQGVVLATPDGRALVVSDYADNLARIRGLIGQIDQDNAAIETITLRNSSAREIVTAVNQLLVAQGTGQSRVMLAPVGSSNSVVLRGDPALVRSVLGVIADLDQRAASSDDVRVVRLQHANAEALLPVLQQVVGQTPTPVPDAEGTVDVTAGAVAPVMPQSETRRANIAVFQGANALIISADPETQRILADVVRQLDTRREQVLVEAIVVEVSDDAAKKLGVQFQLAGQDGSAVPFFSTNYSNTAPNLLALTGAVYGEGLLPDDTLADVRDAAVNSLLSATGGLVGLGVRSNDLLFGAIINAVKSDAASNLLSTPSVLTLDNEEATLLVGQEIPVTTGEVLGDANTNPFRTVARQNVGVQLEVKPQINAGGAITLLLRQEVSSVAGPVSAGFTELVLNKREISTTVLVDDGDIVVLGGLLDQNESVSVEKVPGLGDIPVLGNLFRSNAVTSRQRNLMVFIRPTIVRNPVDAQNLTAPRYDFMRDQEISARRDGTSALEALVRDYMRTNPPVTSAPVETPAQSQMPASAPASDTTAP